jgi:hypothetical protein
MKKRWALILGGMASFTLVLIAYKLNDRPKSGGVKKPADITAKKSVSTDSISMSAGQSEPVQQSEQQGSIATQREFNELSEKVLRELPTISELSKLSNEEVHQTPRRILEAGLEIGKVVEMLEANPELTPQATQFYEKCSYNSNYPTSVRALCFSHLRTLDPSQANDSRIPAHIREISEKI